MWLRGGYAVARRWVRGGYAVARRWLRGGYAVATRWLHALASGPSPSGERRMYATSFFIAATTSSEMPEVSTCHIRTRRRFIDSRHALRGRRGAHLPY